MKPITIFAVVLVAAGSLYRWNPQAATPIVPAIEPPSAQLQLLVAPVTRNLTGRPVEARLLAAFYYEASETIRRDGLNAKIVKTKPHLVAFCERAATLRFQGAFSKVPGLAAVIHGPDGVIAKVLGLEPGELDHAKSAEVLHAIAWACQEAEQ